jgi:hypothetical protein
MNFALETKKMELSLMISLAITMGEKLTSGNPAYLDLAKLIIGSVLWIGGLTGFMYWKQSRIKTATIK